MTQLKIIDLSQSNAAKQIGEVQEKTERLLDICRLANYAGRLAGDENLLLRLLVALIKFTQCDSANEHPVARRESDE